MVGLGKLWYFERRRKLLLNVEGNLPGEHRFIKGLAMMKGAWIPDLLKVIERRRPWYGRKAELVLKADLAGSWFTDA